LTIILILKGVLAPTIFVTEPLGIISRKEPLGIISRKVRQHRPCWT